MRILYSFALLVALVIYSLPYVIKDQSLIWLKQQGINYPKLTDVSISWLSGKVEITGLAAHKKGFTPLQVDKLQLTIDLPSLFDKKLLINNLALTGFNASFEQKNNETFVGPINLTKLQGSNTSKAPEAPSESKLQFGLKKLSLNDILFTLNIPKFQHQLQLNNTDIENFYQWAPEQLSLISIDGHINDAPLTINSQSSPLSSQRQTQLKLTLKKLPIDSIAAPFVKDLAMTLDANIDVNFKADQQTFSIEHSGDLQLSAFHWKNDVQKVAFDKFIWKGDGKLTIDLNGESSIKNNGEITLEKLKLDAADKAKSAGSSAPQLTLDAFQWQGPIEASLQKQTLSKLNLAEELKISGLNIKAPVNLSIANLDLRPGKNPLQLLFDNNAIQQIESSASSDIKSLALSEKDLKLSFNTLSLSHAKPLLLKFNKGQLSTITDTTKLNISALSMAQDALKIAANSIALSGPLSIANVSQSPLITSQLSTDVAGLKVAQGHLAISAKQIALTSTLNQLDPKKPKVQQASVNLSQLDISDIKQSISLFSTAKLAVNNAAYTPSSISVESIKSQNLKLANTQSAALSQIASLGINKIQLNNNNNLKIANVALNDSSHNIQILESGQIALLEQLQRSFASTPETKTSSQTKAKADNSTFLFAIDQINVSGKNRVDFEDKSVDPWFKSQIDINKINVGALSNSSSRPSPFQIKALLNQETNLSAQGEYALFSQDKTGNWQVALDNFSLPIISPYAGKASGYFLDSGKLNVDSKGNIDKGVIKGTNKVQVQQLAVRSAGSDATQKTNKSLSMPLDLAIALLEDDDGNIDLSVPISGSVDDPNFGYSSVVEIIAKKGMKQAAFSLLTKTLQPYGALLTVANTVIDAKNSGTFINLEPINFQPGDTNISPKMQDYIVKLGTMMKERKKLKLKLCGNAVTADHSLLGVTAAEENAALKTPLDPIALEKALINQLQNLATDRTKVIKDALIKQKVSDDRLFVCYAKVQLKDKKATPSVTLGL